MKTKEQFLEKLANYVTSNDAEAAHRLLDGDYWYDDEDVEYESDEGYDVSPKVIYRQNYGDGNYMEHVYQIDDVIVLVNGTYSSHDSNSYDEVYYAKPYTFSETRYQRA